MNWYQKIAYRSDRSSTNPSSLYNGYVCQCGSQEVSITQIKDRAEKTEAKCLRCGNEWIVKQENIEKLRASPDTGNGVGFDFN